MKVDLVIKESKRAQNGSVLWFLERLPGGAERKVNRYEAAKYLTDDQRKVSAAFDDIKRGWGNVQYAASVAERIDNDPQYGVSMAAVKEARKGFTTRIGGGA